MSIFSIKLFAIWIRFWRNISTLISFLILKSEPIKTFTNANDIASELQNGNNWKPDPGKRGNFDVTIHPAVTQWKINNNKYGEKANDCDDHAMYWCAALYKSKLAKHVWFVQINWENSAHAFCVFKTYDNKYYWTDYNNPIEIADKWAWLYSVNQTYGQIKAKYAMMHHVTMNKSGKTPKLKTSEIRKFK